MTTDNNNDKYTKNVMADSDLVNNTAKKNPKTVFSYSEIPAAIKEKMLGLSMPYGDL